MNRNAIALSLGLLFGPALAQGAIAQGAPSAITEAEAHAIGVDAYVYLYSLVTMDVTRKQLTNIEPGKGTLGGPMNTFANSPAFPAADFKAVVRPNFDTLYSSAYLDLTKEPMIVSVPDTGGRYYLLPCSTCGQTFLRPQVGVPPERRRGTSSWFRKDGSPICATG
jgi:hypothetical protein